MKKSILIAVAITLVLCVYGYFASTAGHDHSKHQEDKSHNDMHGSEHAH